MPERRSVLPSPRLTCWLSFTQKPTPERTQSREVMMLIRKKINDPDTLLKLFVATDNGLKGVQPYFTTTPLPCDRQGGSLQLELHWRTELLADSCSIMVARVFSAFG